jgi:MFS transporter, MHS family, shikimate and dehydroshikimate transport protein
MSLPKAIDPTSTGSLSNDATPPRASSNRVIAAAFIGTLIEWYDFFLYGTAAALVFNKLFFPTFDPVAGTMAAFGTYAVGFFARPIGGIIFGHFGDKIGRKSILIVTLLMMGLATFGIGLLPTYNQIGVAAPILLVFLRIVQGLALGGEWGGAVLMTVEHSEGHRRGFAASWPQAGSPAGLILGTGVFAFFAARPEAEFLSWGWRVPFLLGILLTAVGFFIRFGVGESPVFHEMKAREQSAKWPVLEAFRTEWKNILITIGARMAENASFYVFTVFLLSYGTTFLELPKSIFLNAVLIAAACEFFTIPMFGALSDRFGRRPIYIFGTVFLALSAFPFFWLLNTKSALLINLAVVAVMAIGHAAMYAPQASFFSELFSTKVRFSGASLGAQISAPLAGGLAPLICTALIEIGQGDPWLVSIYLILLAAISCISVYVASETNRRSL